MKYEIRLGNQQDVEELKELWQDVFMDDQSYIDKFFECEYNDKTTLVATNHSKIIAALYMIGYGIMIEGERKPALYLYALSTKENFRKNGIMSSLIKMSEQYAIENGYEYQFLIPASTELYNYYRKFHFGYGYSKTTVTMKIKKDNTVKKEYFRIENSTLEQVYSRYQKSSFVQNGCVYIDNISYALYLFSIAKANCRLLSILNKDKEIAYAIVIIRKGILDIIQTDINIKDINQFANSMANYFDVEELNFIQPNLQIFQLQNVVKKIEPYGMIKCIGKNNRAMKINKINNDWLYVNMVLD